MMFSVTENGFCVKNENSLTIKEAVKDSDRIEFFSGNLDALLKAVTVDGSDVRSYFGWSESILWIVACQTTHPLFNRPS